jgi:hypothetical protein
MPPVTLPRMRALQTAELTGPGARPADVPEPASHIDAR